ncbi:MAG: VTT domain-containing protein [Rubrivivax sp.]|nr:VTT domain-containing protein [Rubrivivax sp.]
MIDMLLLWATAPDQALAQGVLAYGSWALGLVALVVFAETGLVVAPFLPGDSLLFVTGAVVAASGYDPHATVALLVGAALLGDGLNFAIGRRLGPWALARWQGRWPRPSHLQATQAWFARFGGWTIVLARFMPVLRTFAPFLAGVGRMPGARFAAFNLLGALAWVGALVYAGVWFGELPQVRTHLGLWSMVIVATSLTPLAWAALRRRSPGT